MSEDDSPYSLPRRALDGERRDHSHGSPVHPRIAHLEEELAQRDAKIADLKSLVWVLWATLFCVFLVWGLREWLSR